MTGAGSGETLQQRLTADLALWMHNSWSSVKHTDAAKVDQDCKDDADSVMYGLWPLIEAALLAARVGTATQIAEKIEHDPHNGWVQNFTDAGSHSRQRSPKEWAEFVRSVGGVPETEKP